MYVVANGLLSTIRLTSLVAMLAYKEDTFVAVISMEALLSFANTLILFEDKMPASMRPRLQQAGKLVPTDVRNFSKHWLSCMIPYAMSCSASSREKFSGILGMALGIALANTPSMVRKVKLCTQAGRGQWPRSLTRVNGAQTNFRLMNCCATLFSCKKEEEEDRRRNTQVIEGGQEMKQREEESSVALKSKISVCFCHFFASPFCRSCAIPSSFPRRCKSIVRSTLY